MKTQLSHIRDLFLKGKIEDALNEMLSLAKEKNKPLYDDIFLQCTLYKTIQRDEQQGIIKAEDVRIERNRIIKASIEILKDWENEQLQFQERGIQVVTLKTSKRTWIGRLGQFIGLFSILLLLFIT